MGFLDKALKSVKSFTEDVIKDLPESKYFGPLQIKLTDDVVADPNIPVKKIMLRGKLPVTKSMEVGCCISAVDVTEEDNPAVVAAIIDEQQEITTRCLLIDNDFGRCNVGESFIRWVQIGLISPFLIQPPKSGVRTIRFVIRFYDQSNPIKIMNSRIVGGKAIASYRKEFDYDFAEKGWEEEAEDRDEAQAISLKIGVAVAMADGNLDDSEGEILKNWILKEVSTYSDAKSDQLKKLYNDSLKEAFVKAQSGDLSLSPLCERLLEIGETKTKYDAIQLAFDVMAADGVADPEEMQVIRNVAKALDLDMEEIEKMRENVTLSLATNLKTDKDLEALVGIEDLWSDDQKKKHLRQEFQKWSNRLNSLPEGEEREQAQYMLDSIASLRKEYG